jgi:hypothetical protein
MLARLLLDFDVDLDGLDGTRAISSRRMLGTSNQRFYVPSAKLAVDSEGRSIIPAREFVSQFGVETVFGIGRRYVDGTLVATLVFSSENMDELTVDRFPSTISNFKIATNALLLGRKLYARGRAA